MSDANPSPLTPAVFSILLTLADGPRHGYAILKELEEYSGRPASPGTVYGALGRLSEAGLVAEAEGVDEGDKRRNLSYWLTEAGAEAFAAEAERITRLAKHPEVRRAVSKRKKRR